MEASRRLLGDAQVLEAILDIIGTVADLVSWPFLARDRRRRLSRRLERSEGACLRCGRQLPPDRDECPTCGWTFLVPDPARPPGISPTAS